MNNPKTKSEIVTLSPEQVARFYTEKKTLDELAAKSPDVKKDSGFFKEVYIITPDKNLMEQLPPAVREAVSRGQKQVVVKYLRPQPDEWFMRRYRESAERELTPAENLGMLIDEIFYSARINAELAALKQTPLLPDTYEFGTGVPEECNARKAAQGIVVQEALTGYTMSAAYEYLAKAIQERQTSKRAVEVAKYIDSQLGKQSEVVGRIFRHLGITFIDSLGPENFTLDMLDTKKGKPINDASVLMNPKYNLKNAKITFRMYELGLVDETPGGGCFFEPEAFGMLWMGAGLKDL